MVQEHVESLRRRSWQIVGLNQYLSNISREQILQRIPGTIEDMSVNIE